jgi:hypothetical protein
MRNAESLDLEQLRMKAAAGTIIQRWRYGRRLLMDGTATLPNGRMKHGVTGQLVLMASAAGYKLSEREVQWRLQCAREYETESEIQEILAEFDSWGALRDANFPNPNSAQPYGSYSAVGEESAGQERSLSPEDEDGGQEDRGDRPYDPRTTDEIIRDHEARGRRLLAQTWEPGEYQLSLFKPDKLDAESTLADLKKYADEQAELTARFAAIDQKRSDYLQKLIDAVHGDMSKTWREAEEALADIEEQ